MQVSPQGFFLMSRGPLTKAWQVERRCDVADTNEVASADSGLSAGVSGNRDFQDPFKRI